MVTGTQSHIEKRSDYLVKMSDKDFRRLSDFVQGELGIKMPDVKREMLECRLQKRIKALNFSAFSDYVEFVFSSAGSSMELLHMIDAVTTNKTDFFREPIHYEQLRDTVIPAFSNANGRKELKIWSAGCSSGEEPYTLCMILAEMVEQRQVGDFSIFASDISVRVLEYAANAIYSENKISGIPNHLLRKYFMKSKDPENKVVRVIPQLRKKVTFRRINFMDTFYNIDTVFDVIFCRNVLIYFDRETQEAVINRLLSKLSPSGYLFLGHSESIISMKLPLQQLKPTFYKKI